MQTLKSLFTLLFLAVILCGVSYGMTDFRRKQVKVRAPELIGGRSWLNTDKPLSLAALKGKIVLLDFWTYGCINCIHIIPDLKKLEAKYPNNLVVIGVHSAKFDNEKDTENIRKIILRYGIEHPVVNDADFKIWQSYAVNAWPTQVLIDPNGYIIRQLSGEGNFAEIDEVITQIIAEFRQKGSLNEMPLALTLEKAKVGNLPLAFPGKVLADEKSNRLFISDSNHNRIVVTDLDGKLLETIGSGAAALTDGDYAKAAFNRPQGLALDSEMLYVADTENHAVRKINLTNKTVETISGDGKQAAWRSAGGAAKSSRLSSPWDLAKVNDALYIAMAGTHQIWQLDLAKQTVAPFAGTGAEARVDAAVDESAFAQPSGIVSDGKNLYIADSESNIIREISLQKNTVETLAGGDLFDFGDKDGEGDDVRLQHPLGVTLYDGKVLIADTYNHKIKQLDTTNRDVKTFIGSGKGGQADGAKAQFYEPGGLSVAGGKLYVADTNNQAIRVVDLKTKQVSTLKIEGLKPPAEVIAQTASGAPNLKELKVETRNVAANSQNTLTFDIALPAGYHLNQDAPNRYEITPASGGNIKIVSPKGKLNKLPFDLNFQTAGNGESKFNAKFTLYYCREDNTGECLIKTLAWQIPVKVAPNGEKLTSISTKLD